MSLFAEVLLWNHLGPMGRASELLVPLAVLWFVLLAGVASTARRVPAALWLLPPALAMGLGTAEFFDVAAGPGSHTLAGEASQRLGAALAAPIAGLMSAMTMALALTFLAGGAAFFAGRGRTRTSMAGIVGPQAFAFAGAVSLASATGSAGVSLLDPKILHYVGLAFALAFGALGASLCGCRRPPDEPEDPLTAALAELRMVVGAALLSLGPATGALLWLAGERDFQLWRSFDDGGAVGAVSAPTWQDLMPGYVGCPLSLVLGMMMILPVLHGFQRKSVALSGALAALLVLGSLGAVLAVCGNVLLTGL